MKSSAVEEGGAAIALNSTTYWGPGPASVLHLPHFGGRRLPTCGER